MLTTSQYDAIFEKERGHSYPIIDAYERMHGYALDRDKLESMARTLACPLKVNPPNWQHGRVIYTTLRYFLTKQRFDQRVTLLDIGTAKGFSACVMSHAVGDSGSDCLIISVDVVDPNARVARNSAAELDGLKTLDEFVRGHNHPNVPINFFGRGSIPWLNYALEQNGRVPFAFVDGKHTYEQVCFESSALSQLQRPGDVVVFDDCQIEPVGRAVREARTYSVSYVDIGPRTYAIGIRK